MISATAHLSPPSKQHFRQVIDSIQTKMVLLATLKRSKN